MSKHRSNRGAQRAVPVFAALGDATRLIIVSRLVDGQSHSIAELTNGLSLTRQGITKHLGILERAGIVKSRRVGRESRFSYLPKSIEYASSYLDSVCAQWDDALSRLKTFVESDSAGQID